MYDESYNYYDLIYHWKDYKRESDKLIKIINKFDSIFKQNKSHTVLDIGCGTGVHHKYLKKHFSIDGLDINKDFLNIAKKKNPECNYYERNMINFSLDKEYDIIISLFSSIGYTKTIDNLNKAMKCFFEHLNTSGILIIEPWFTPDKWIAGKLTTNVVDREDIKICRMSKSGLDKNVSIMDMNYLIGKKTENIKYFKEVHKMGLFSIDEMKQAFTENGFNVKYNAKGISDRGVYIGKKNDF
jgi:trans-aconitate methyltransferase